MPVTKYQVKSVIAAYIKNVKTRIGAPKPAIALSSDERGMRTPKRMIEDMMYDRVGEHVLERLKKSKIAVDSADVLKEE